MPRSLRAEGSNETKRFLDRQIRLGTADGCAGPVLLKAHNATPLDEHRATKSTLNCLDLNQEDWLHELGLGSQHADKEVVSSSGDNLVGSNQ